MPAPLGCIVGLASTCNRIVHLANAPFSTIRLAVITLP